jgi:uncharacterized protein (TIGR02646 family)
MIRIKRDVDEPRELKTARENHLEKAIEAFEKCGASSDEFKAVLKDGYNSNATKERLYQDQKKKCAWCERKTPLSSNPVEHYRPKNRTWRHLRGHKRKRIDPEHYWWLTWTWSNLLFSCNTCNDQAHKANYFPLARRTQPMAHLAKPIPKPLTPSAFDTSLEQPLLLDPADLKVDPLDHIRWRPTIHSQLRPRDEWIWTPIGKSTRGKATIRILKLEEWSEDVAMHLKTSILPSIEEIEKHLSASPKRPKDARERWDKLLATTLAPESELSAATWCALKIWMPEKKRQENGLTKPRRPGT